MKTNRKAAQSAIWNGLENQLIAGGNQSDFVFDCRENHQQNQAIKCDLCNPSLEKPRGAAKLCPKCEVDRERTAQTFFENFKKHGRVYKLDCFCFACNSRKTSAMMAKIIPICRKCADELKTKGTIAQSNFISRATNNFLREIKKAVTV